jgi:uncharacterized protein
LHLTLVEYLVVLVAGGVGAAVQGALGFGANLIAVPVVAVVAPEALPATLVLWVVPLVITMAVRERQGVDWSGVRWTTLGRLPGTALGAWIAATVASDTLSVLCGLAVLVAVGASVWTADVPFGPATKTAAGFASGAMATATSIGGPPLALLYQRQDGRVLRSTLAMAFTIGTAVSLTGLAVAGAIEPWHVLLAFAMAPGLAGGLALSGTLSRRLDGARLRPAVLGLATVAALVAIARGLG